MRIAKIFSFMLFAVMAGCGFNVFFGPDPTGQNSNSDDSELGISIATPRTTVTVQSGGSTTLRWADIASIPNTVVRLQAQREAAPDAFTGPVIHLIGDGTPGSGRDALADGVNDTFEWDLEGVRIGEYLITATIESPDGQTKVAKSQDEDFNLTGLISVTTALPFPTLAFTQPAADTDVTTGNTFDITWTDNGDDNADALVTLMLDTDEDHTNGNEIILVRDEPLSTNGDGGLFTFAFLDENGDTIADGSYTVVARVDDNAHDVAFFEATGKLNLNP